MEEDLGPVERFIDREVIHIISFSGILAPKKSVHMSTSQFCDLAAAQLPEAPAQENTPWAASILTMVKEFKG